MRHENLLVEPRDQPVVTVPLADIAVMVVSHPQVHFTHAVLAGLASRGGVFVTCGANQLSERRFPPSHSDHLLNPKPATSVSERRFPPSHSENARMRMTAKSVSERRFPPSHSNLMSKYVLEKSVSERRFPPSHSRKVHACGTGNSVSERRFPPSHSASGCSSLLFTSVSERRFPPSHSAPPNHLRHCPECIRAAVPTKPQPGDEAWYQGR